MPKKPLMMAGIEDCYTSGCTGTLGNFTKITFHAISKTYSYLAADVCKEMVFATSPYPEFTDHPVKTHTSVSNAEDPVPVVASSHVILYEKGKVNKVLLKRKEKKRKEKKRKERKGKGYNPLKKK